MAAIDLCLAVFNEALDLHGDADRLTYASCLAIAGFDEPKPSRFVISQLDLIVHGVLIFEGNVWYKARWFVRYRVVLQS